MGAFTGMAPIMPAILNTLMGEAQVQREQLGNELEGLQIQNMRQRMQQEKVNSQSLAQAMQGGVSSMDPSLMPSDSDSPVTAAVKEAKRQQANAQFMQQIAVNTGKAGGSPELVLDAMNKAALAAQRATAARKEADAEQREQTKRIGDIAEYGKTDENFDAAYAQLKNEDPVLAGKLQWDKTPNGTPTAGPISRKTMETLAAKTESVKDQQKAKHDADEALRKEQEEKRKEADAEEKRREGDALIAQRQAAAGLSNARAKALGEDKGATKEADRLQTVANKDPSKDALASAENQLRSSPYFKEYKFDSTFPMLAHSVAERANRIRAEAAKQGQSMSMDEAREQAIQELKPFVVTKTTNSDHPIPYLSEPKLTYSYQRGSTKPAVGAAGPQPSSDQELMIKLDKVGVKGSVSNGKVTGPGGGPILISSKEQMDALPHHTKFLWIDGKEWTSP